MESGRRAGVTGWLLSRTGLVLLGFFAVAAFFLVTEHTAHVFGVLPYLLVLSCLLLHRFMHGGHRSPGGHRDRSSSGGER